jgi:hypothetical protein
MPAERLPMRKVREVLRLKYARGASGRVIAQSAGIGRTAVGEYVRRPSRRQVCEPNPASAFPDGRPIVTPMAVVGKPIQEVIKVYFGSAFLSQSRQAIAPCPHLPSKRLVFRYAIPISSDVDNWTLKRF